MTEDPQVRRRDGSPLPDPFIDLDLLHPPAQRLHPDPLLKTWRIISTIHRPHTTFEITVKAALGIIFSP
ncbi:hypothetical protein EII34_03320 [Arachnia propionica]|uniref:Uncharacterized protein n=1 Tax=Arachnia propionica TaxID=1750 RepID=A0A3P1TBJ7_9ACTN|nr:hypothetical protein [Arachnia propionica]RRD06668.1 hypothetical protein EII34_03320 [Arachnia propionica]